MTTPSLFNSLLVLAITLAATFISLAYLLGQFILKSESVHVKAFTIGFDFLAILVVNILLASWAIRYIAILGSNTFRVLGFICLLLLIVISTQKLRTYLSQRKVFSKIIWEVCVFGIIPYPLFIVDLSLYHYGSVRTMSYVQGAALPTFVTIFLGIYFALKFYAGVIYRNEGSLI